MSPKLPLHLALVLTTLSALFTLGSGCSSSTGGGEGGAGATTSTTTSTSASGSVGSGSGTSCTAATVTADCGANTDCLAFTCIGAQCHATPMAKGTSCDDGTGSRCDGSGSCVPPHCISAVTDGTETGTDCGGSSPPCTNGQLCVKDADCQSGYCGPGTKPAEKI
ncbi:MAG: hypothetical protein FJ096_19150 [Deltaproteobacteria bacterium]|nr:hypothetical protein [Deltaproteobacteria bacterium]